MVAKQPPPSKCLPSWKTTRPKVWSVGQVAPIQSLGRVAMPLKVSYCRLESLEPAGGFTPSRMTSMSRLPPPPGAMTYAIGVPLGIRLPPAGGSVVVVVGGLVVVVDVVTVVDVVVVGGRVVVVVVEVVGAV